MLPSISVSLRVIRKYSHSAIPCHGILRCLKPNVSSFGYRTPVQRLKLSFRSASETAPSSLLRAFSGVCDHLWASDDRKMETCPTIAPDPSPTLQAAHSALLGFSITPSPNGLGTGAVSAYLARLATTRCFPKIPSMDYVSKFQTP